MQIVNYDADTFPGRRYGKETERVSFEACFLGRFVKHSLKVILVFVLLKRFARNIQKYRKIVHLFGKQQPEAYSKSLLKPSLAKIDLFLTVKNGFRHRLEVLAQQNVTCSNKMDFFSKEFLFGKHLLGFLVCVNEFVKKNCSGQVFILTSASGRVIFRFVLIRSGVDCGFTRVYCSLPLVTRSGVEYIDKISFLFSTSLSFSLLLLVIVAFVVWDIVATAYNMVIPSSKICGDKFFSFGGKVFVVCTSNSDARSLRLASLATTKKVKFLWPVPQREELAPSLVSSYGALQFRAIGSTNSHRGQRLKKGIYKAYHGRCWA